MEKRRSYLKRWAAVVLPVFLVAVAVPGTSAAVAQASVRPGTAIHVPQICGNSGTGYCLNDWNGSIGDVKMYYGGYANDSFRIVSVLECNGDSTVLGAPNYCPFSNHALDTHLAGLGIFEFESGANPGWCVGSAANNSLTILQPCGGTGTVFIGDDVYASCPAGIFHFVSQYWSNHYGTYEYLESGNALGHQADEDYSGSSPTCWGYHSS